jgi:hypothetical protein
MRLAVVVANVRTSFGLAADHEAHAGHHRLFVNVETATAGIENFHHLLLTRRRRGHPNREL